MIPRVLFVAAEAIPLAKTGGLGDVVTALAIALHERGIDVTVIMPGYAQALDQIRSARQIGVFEDLPGGPAQLLHGLMPDSELPVVLLRNDAMYCRPGGPYQQPDGREFGDNAIRFGALCHAAARIGLGETRIDPPQVVHAHDWHAGLTPLLMTERAERLGLTRAATVSTIHNLAFQGNFSLDLCDALGIEPSHRGADGVEFWNQLSFLKAGLAFADRITTVSHTYAEEILTPRFGCGLEGILNARRELLSSVANGIDTDVWDPARDKLIPANYTPSDLKGKVTCKKGLQQLFGLAPDPFAPVIAQGSRLTGQKMADTAIDAVESLLTQYPRMQFAALGTGEHGLEQRYRDFAARHPGRVGVVIGYDERSAHTLHAGADMLLHGSRFEPFGLTPVYSMRYGTVPIASRVGGLVDTICDHGPSEEPVTGATGFLFDGDSPNDMAQAISRALDAFEKPRTWREMQRDGMRGEYGWKASAGQYIDLYQTATKGRGRGAFRLPPAHDSTTDKTAATAKKRA